MDKSQEDLLKRERVVDAFLHALPTTETLKLSQITNMLDAFVYRFISYYPTLHVPAMLNEVYRTSVDGSGADIFTCGSCGQLFEDPVTLFCPDDSHTFCKNCVKDAHRCTTCGSSVPIEFSSGISPSLTIQALLDYVFPRKMKCYENRKQGNRLIKNGDFRGAIGKYTEAIEHDGNSAVLFSNRCQAYTLLEDYTSALSDADRTIALRPLWSKGHYRRAIILSRMDNVQAALESTLLLMLLDRTVMATRDLLKDQFRRFLTKEIGIRLNAEVESSSESARGSDPSAEAEVSRQDLTTILQRLENTVHSTKTSMVGKIIEEAENSAEKQIAASKSSHTDSNELPAGASPEKLEELLTCTLCYRLLYRPITPNCGHSFCGVCLQRVLDFKPSCPQCRHDLSIYLAYRQFGVSEVLQKFIARYLPTQLVERTTVHQTEMQSLSKITEEEMEVAIFVLNAAYPGMPFSLHVFEPRYRLMMRQAMESGSRIFGMCEYTGSRGETFADIGTMLYINHLEHTEDGRCFVSAIGQRRFKVLSRGMRDGIVYSKFVSDLLRKLSLL
ncbi:hypothetical protein RvY_09195-2 [Ramazzottius varieornatus]|uniref:RING-type domain-containing protein n=1 Tax=Ramazzottius varieornatus TaxID=947166 RepID=A0A1D1VE21_RAMVA|nr:hypothetical protein RvY_09195-2 [Ramazzottius varieornatus]